MDLGLFALLDLCQTGRFSSLETSTQPSLPSLLKLFALFTLNNFPLHLFVPFLPVFAHFRYLSSLGFLPDEWSKHGIWLLTKWPSNHTINLQEFKSHIHTWKGGKHPLRFARKKKENLLAYNIFSLTTETLIHIEEVSWCLRSLLIPSSYYEICPESIHLFLIDDILGNVKPLQRIPLRNSNNYHTVPSTFQNRVQCSLS